MLTADSGRHCSIQSHYVRFSTSTFPKTQCMYKLILSRIECSVHNWQVCPTSPINCPWFARWSFHPHLSINNHAHRNHFKYQKISQKLGIFFFMIHTYAHKNAYVSKTECPMYHLQKCYYGKLTKLARLIAINKQTECLCFSIIQPKDSNNIKFAHIHTYQTSFLISMA